MYGFALSGAIAQFAAMPCSKAGLKPRALNFTEAAALPVAALTSISALERSDLKRGEKILIIGASGGCGMFAIKISKVL